MLCCFYACARKQLCTFAPELQTEERKKDRITEEQTE